MKLKILVIDDDPIVAFIQKKMILKLELKGELSVHSNGKVALDYLDCQETDNAIYLVLLDINMPVMNGWQFLDAIQSRVFKHNFMVVVVSSSTLKKDRKKALSYKQVKDYLVKPVMQESWNRILALPQLSVFHENSEVLQKAS